MKDKYCALLVTFAEYEGANIPASEIAGTITETMMEFTGVHTVAVSRPWSVQDDDESS